MDADGTILLEIITLVSVLGGVGSSVYATKISANNKKIDDLEKSLQLRQAELDSYKEMEKSIMHKVQSGVNIPKFAYYISQKKYLRKLAREYAGEKSLKFPSNVGKEEAAANIKRAEEKILKRSNKSENIAQPLHLG